LEVDHITPRSKGGLDVIENFQALCYSCNAMKQDRDDTDFRAVRAAYGIIHPYCPFCTTAKREVLLQNSLALVVKDEFPVSVGHVLIIPKRHEPEYFDLGTAETRACERLLFEARALLQGGLKDEVECST
jgi:hypothetical protein